MSHKLDTTPTQPELIGLVEASPAPLWIASGQGERRYFNAAWYSLTGRSCETELGHGWRENLHSEDRDRVDRTIAGACESKRAYGTLYRLACQHEEWRTIEEHARPVLREGKVDYWLGTCRDTTQERLERGRYVDLAQLLAFVASANSTQLALDEILLEFDTETRHGAVFVQDADGEARLECAPCLSNLSEASCSNHIREAIRTGKPVIADNAPDGFTETGSAIQLPTIWALPITAPLPGVFAVFFESSTLPSDEQVEDLAPWVSLVSLALRIDAQPIGGEQ